MEKVGVKYQDFKIAAQKIKTSGNKIEKREGELNKAQQVAIRSWTGQDVENFNNKYKNFEKDMKNLNFIYIIKETLN